MRSMRSDTYIDYGFLAPGLAQGAQPPTGPALRNLGFDVVVLAAEEYQPPAAAFPGVLVVHAPSEDGPDIPLGVIPLAQKLARMIRAGKKVLITCFAGLNRSGLISALVLRYLGVGSGEEAVWRVRAGRPGALSNPWFRAWLMTMPPHRQRARLGRAALGAG